MLVFRNILCTYSFVRNCWGGGLNKSTKSEIIKFYQNDGGGGGGGSVILLE